MSLYHGTTKINGGKIKKEGFHVNLLDIVVVERDRRYWNRSIGTLGYGLYTFKDDPQLAYDFASKFDSEDPVVFKIPNVIPKNNLLDLTDFQVNKRFKKFCQFQRNSEHGERIYKHVKHNCKVKSYAGIMTELFILFLKIKYNKRVLGVERWTETDLPNVRYGMGTNGIEVTIRDAKLIKRNEVKELGKEDIYGSKRR